MEKTTTSLEVRRVGKKVKLYAIGRTPKGTKYIVNSIEMAQLPNSKKVDPAKIEMEVNEVLGQTPA